MIDWLRREIFFLLEEFSHFDRSAFDDNNFQRCSVIEFWNSKDSNELLIEEKNISNYIMLNRMERI